MDFVPVEHVGLGPLLDLLCVDVLLPGDVVAADFGCLLVCLRRCYSSCCSP